MVRLRKLGSEFHGPQDFQNGVQMHMPYLDDFAAFQEYMDGDLSKLWIRNLGNEATQEVTGAKLYKDADPKLAYVQLNFFRAALRYATSAVFERNPTALDAEDADIVAWDAIKDDLIKYGRQAVEWRISKGHGVCAVERSPAAVDSFQPVDSRGYIPLVHRVNRDKVIGHCIYYLWWSKARVVGIDIPDRITLYIYVDEKGAAESDGYIDGPVNIVRTMEWSGSQGQGFASGKFGEGIEELDFSDDPENARIQGIWAFGDGDSIFSTMEHTVYNALLALTHARTALSQDIRSTRILPQVTDPQFLNADGTVKENPLRPTYRVPVDADARGLAGLGYLAPPGPDMAAAQAEMYLVHITDLAYAANMPPEAFGRNYTAGEPAEAITKLQQIFLTWVLDTRDDLGKIYTQAAKILTGRDIKVGWELDPFGNTKEYRDEIRQDLKDGIIELSWAQEKLGRPVVAIARPTTESTQDGDTDAP